MCCCTATLLFIMDLNLMSIVFIQRFRSETLHGKSIHVSGCTRREGRHHSAFGQKKLSLQNPNAIIHYNRVQGCLTERLRLRCSVPHEDSSLSARHSTVTRKSTKRPKPCEIIDRISCWAAFCGPLRTKWGVWLLSGASSQTYVYTAHAEMRKRTRAFPMHLRRYLR
jgi:hypothetical protein